MKHEIIISLHGLAARLFFFTHSEKKAGRHQMQNFVKQNENIRTG